MVRFAATASRAEMSRVVIRSVRADTCVSRAFIKVRRFAMSVSCWVTGWGVASDVDFNLIVEAFNERQGLSRER